MRIHRLLPLLLVFSACTEATYDAPPADVVDALEHAVDDARFMAFARPGAVDDAADALSAVGGAGVLEAWQQMKGKLDGGPVHPIDDISYMALSGESMENLVGFGRTTASSSKIADAMDQAAPNAERRQDGDVTTWSVPVKGPREAEIIDLQIALAGDMVAVARGDLARTVASSASPVNEVLLALAGPVASFDAWMLVRDVQSLAEDDEMEEGLDEARRAGMQELAMMVQAVQHMAIGGNVERDMLTGRLVIIPRDGIDAGDLKDLVEGAIAAVRMQANLPEVVRDQLEEIKVRSAGGRVIIDASVMTEVFRQFMPQ